MYLFLLESAISGNSSFNSAIRGKYKEWMGLMLKIVTSNNPEIYEQVTITLALLDWLMIQRLFYDEELPVADILTTFIKSIRN